MVLNTDKERKRQTSCHNFVQLKLISESRRRMVFAKMLSSELTEGFCEEVDSVS